jgi:hypothetical protein
MVKYTFYFIGPDKKEWVCQRKEGKSLYSRFDNSKRWFTDDEMEIFFPEFDLCATEVIPLTVNGEENN